ncbi:MAG: S1 RNA-binding domain-containing protein [Acutalibacteraceae bacterium]
MTYYPEGHLLKTKENLAAMHSWNTLAESMKQQRILEARVQLCDSSHNLIVNLHGVRGIIPREEGALGIREGTVRDIAVITRVNRPVSFVIDRMEKDETGTPLLWLSRRKAQERCQQEYLSSLCPGDVIPARVTHLEPFGAFVDIGCGNIALIPIDSISVSRIDHPCQRYHVDDDIRVVVKSIHDGRITLSQKELLGTWMENANRFHAGETTTGIVRSVENYGIFVELAPNLAGLAEWKADIHPGHLVSVYIKSIVPSRMKVKLIIIEEFELSPFCAPTIFFQGDHMDTFLYSPPLCEKRIETIFGQVPCSPVSN